jgi:hypothetical protein
MPVAIAILELETFARLRGWELGEVTVDDDPARPLLAWSTLMAVAREHTVAGVLIPDVTGLRPPPLALEQLRIRCAREVGAPLLLATPAPMSGRSAPLLPSSFSPSRPWSGWLSHAHAYTGRSGSA